MEGHKNDYGRPAETTPRTPIIPDKARLIGKCRCGRLGQVAVGLNPAAPDSYCARHLFDALDAVEELLERAAANGVPIARPEGEHEAHMAQEREFADLTHDEYLALRDAEDRQR